MYISLLFNFYNCYILHDLAVMACDLAMEPHMTKLV